jgi:hypothetical protein
VTLVSASTAAAAAAAVPRPARVIIRPGAYTGPMPMAAAGCIGWPYPWYADVGRIDIDWPRYLGRFGMPARPHIIISDITV